MHDRNDLQPDEHGVLGRVGESAAEAARESAQGGGAGRGPSDRQQDPLSARQAWHRAQHPAGRPIRNERVPKKL